MPELITVKIEGLDKIVKKLNDPTLIIGPLHRLLTDLGLLAQRIARQESPRDTVALARSIGLEVKPLLATVSTDLAYAPVMEFGRGAGKKMPPPGVLAGWMSRHNIPAKFEFVVARAIARRGIKGRFFMRKAADAVEAAKPNRLDAMGREIQQKWES